MDAPLYHRHEVWRASPGRVTRYLCFEDLTASRFFVQQADIFSATPDAAALTAGDVLALELFAETPPAERGPGFASLAEAISAHDRGFADFPLPGPVYDGL